MGTSTASRIAFSRKGSIRRVPQGHALLSSRALPLLLPLPALLLCLWVIHAWRFNGLYGQDPFAYYNYGVISLRATVLHGVALAPMFWPLGYPATITASSLIFGSHPASAQLVSLAAAAATVTLTYLLTQEVLLQSGAPQARARLSAILAATLLGVSGWTLEAGTIVMPDSLSVALSLLSAWTLARWLREENGWRSLGWLSLTATALALAIVTRWGAAWLLPIWLVVALPRLRRGYPLAATLVAVVMPAGLIVGGQLYLALITPPGPIFLPHPFIGDFQLVKGGGWAFDHLWRRDFHSSDGALHYDLPNVVFYATAFLRPKDLTPLFAPALLVGAVVAIRRYVRAVPFLLLWPVVVLGFDAGLAQQNLRFVYEVLPPLAMLAGLGCAVLLQATPQRWRQLSLLLLLVAFLTVAAAGLYDMRKVAEARVQDVVTAQWVQARIPPHSHLLSFDLTLTLQDVSSLRTRDLSAVPVSSLQGLARDSSPRTLPRYLVVRVPAMERQWAQEVPGRDFAYLRRHRMLTPLDRHGAYTLFRITAPQR